MKIINQRCLLYAKFPSAILTPLLLSYDIFSGVVVIDGRYLKVAKHPTLTHFNKRYCIEHTINTKDNDSRILFLIIFFKYNVYSY